MRLPLVNHNPRLGQLYLRHRRQLPILLLKIQLLIMLGLKIVRAISDLRNLRLRLIDIHIPILVMLPVVVLITSSGVAMMVADGIVGI